MIDIATGQVEDRPPTPEEQGKDPAAAALGRKGGTARAKTMTAERRAEIARKAAQKRWKKSYNASATALTILFASVGGNFFAHSTHMACQRASGPHINCFAATLTHSW